MNNSTPAKITVSIPIKITVQTPPSPGKPNAEVKKVVVGPPDPHQEAYKFLLSNDMKQNFFNIGSLPSQSISQIRIHWMLDLIKLRVYSANKVFYDFNYLDELIYMLHENDLQPGFELMGNPSNYFSNFENKTEVDMWMNLVENLAKHYIDIYGIEYVKQWNFETWNEPDHHDFDNLNFTIQGFLNYYDACSEGLFRADKSLRFGGPGGSCRIPSVGHSPICWALLDHCVHGINNITEEKGVRLDFISFHKKGNKSSLYILSEEIETIKYIRSNFPSLKNVAIYNDEADPMKNWSLPQWWRADATYASMVVKIILSHIYYYLDNGSQFFKGLHFDLLSSDNAFLSYFPNQFTERTLLARFQINNTCPKYTEFVKKPVLTIFGLLSKVCPNVLSTKVSDHGKYIAASADKFGVIATQCLPSRNTVVILFNSDDINPGGSVANVNITFHPSSPYSLKTKWATLEVNNKQSNPYFVWTELGKPAYPTVEEFSYIKSREEPYMNGPWDIQNPQFIKFHLEIPNPGVTLINICEIPEVLHQIKLIRFLKIGNQTLQLAWKDEHNKCIKTYKVLYSLVSPGPYRQLNRNNLVFPSYWHACPVSEQDCQIKGFYKIYAVDYWKNSGPSSDSFYFNG
ncbi:hypothetical protein JTE90_029457 [Oedothorax gibbosus]|uniref:Alpha-L-iduronidase n=1 Tax=Oedothorax gibbosus TaxID=931172 RepID=A0AAV6V3F9_9ARAC|nr:hypothetical protein JTE90_029457 [Oedothorax gibbosus]